jgi:hypothetical protein
MVSLGFVRLDPLASCPHHFLHVNVDFTIKLFIVKDSESFFGVLGNDCQWSHTTTITVLVGECAVIVKHAAL